MVSKWGQRGTFLEADLKAAADAYSAGLAGCSGIPISLTEAASMVPCDRLHLMRYLRAHKKPIRARGRPVDGEL